MAYSLGVEIAQVRVIFLRLHPYNFEFGKPIIRRSIGQCFSIHGWLGWMIFGACIEWVSMGLCQMRDTSALQPEGLINALH